MRDDLLVAELPEALQVDRAVQVHIHLQALQGGQGGSQRLQHGNGALRALHYHMHNEFREGRPPTECCDLGGEALLHGVPQPGADAQRLQRRAGGAEAFDVRQRARNLVQHALPLAVLAEGDAGHVQEQLLQDRVCAHELG